MPATPAFFLPCRVPTWRPMRRVLALLVLVALAGCAEPGPSYRDVLNTLIGRPESEAIALLGVPDHTYASDSAGGTKFLGWTSITTRVVPGPYWPGGYYGPYAWRYRGWGHWEPDRYVRTECRTTATVREGRVIEFTLHGHCPP